MHLPSDTAGRERDSTQLWRACGINLCVWPTVPFVWELHSLPVCYICTPEGVLTSETHTDSNTRRMLQRKVNCFMLKEKLLTRRGLVHEMLPA